MAPSGPTKPIVESPPSQGRTAPDEPALQSRIRQQEALADLGVTALKGTPFEHLLNETVRLSVKGLNAEFGKVLEYLPSEDRFVMRAGIGWDAGLAGRATVGADLESPAGFALRTGKPVISNHLESEQRFRTPDLLAAHGVRRAMNVILQGDGAPYGVLEVDSKSSGEFSEHDIAFLQGAANILGMAIERQRRERALQARSSINRCLSKRSIIALRTASNWSRACSVFKWATILRSPDTSKRPRAGSWPSGAHTIVCIEARRSKKLNSPAISRKSAST
jgi:GAF domain-containing protein